MIADGSGGSVTSFSSVDLPASRLLHNDDVAWDEFAPDAYWSHNYRDLRFDDAEILGRVGGWFSEVLDGAVDLHGVDVGSGANLYPALSMLPFCGRITLTDHSAANVAWLRRHVAGGATDPSWTWQPFWDLLSGIAPAYRAIEDPCASLGERVGGQVLQSNVFQLDRHRYDVGTMFFVAESMTSYEDEFEDATRSFLESLRPGAPFAAAFMDSSMGYIVGDKSFPAVREVDLGEVRRVLQSFGARGRVEKVDIPADDPLRDGYQGMLVAVGHTRDA